MYALENSQRIIQREISIQSPKPHCCQWKIQPQTQITWELYQGLCQSSLKTPQGPKRALPHLPVQDGSCISWWAIVWLGTGKVHKQGGHWWCSGSAGQGAEEERSWWVLPPQHVLWLCDCYSLILWRGWSDHSMFFAPSWAATLPMEVFSLDPIHCPHLDWIIVWSQYAPWQSKNILDFFRKKKSNSLAIWQNCFLVVFIVKLCPHFTQEGLSGFDQTFFRGPFKPE